MGEETLDPKNQREGDTKEGFYIARDVSPESVRYDPGRFAAPNVWPDEETCPGLTDPEGWKNTMTEYFDAMSDLGLRVVRLIALSLDLSEDYFDAHFRFPLAAV